MILKPGDRVAVYGYDGTDGFWDGETATVLAFDPETSLVHVEDLEGIKASIHYKQCRRPMSTVNERRRVWLTPEALAWFESARLQNKDLDIAGLIEFVEVRKK